MRVATTLPLSVLLEVPLHAQNRFQQATNIGRVDSIRSATLNEHRPFIVYTPPSYSDTTVVPARYPVLCLLDGAEHFNAVSGLIQALGTGVNGTFAIPEMIVVAIPTGCPNRTRDLTPKSGESVLITGSPRDLELMEDLSVQVRRQGAFPLVRLRTDRMSRRLVVDVPERYDTQVPALYIELADAFDVRIEFDAADDPALLADVPPRSAPRPRTDNGAR